MHNFRKLDIWQKSIDLTVKIYDLTKKFPREEMFGLTSQIKRCAVSIPSNIAEGSGRNTANDFNHFLGIATGSSYELETQLIVAEKLGFADEEEIKSLINEININQKQIYNFKQSLQNRKQVRSLYTLLSISLLK